MSGSSDVSVGGGGEGSLRCDLINIKTVINSPDSSVISQLSAGSVLNVSYQGGALVAVDNKKRIAGSLTPPSMYRVINCMEEGYHYVAIVESIEGGRCIVIIKTKS